jgi:short subunit fatty acids transporter
MTVNVNYWCVALLAIAIVLLIRWMIKRDRKEEKNFKREIIQSELKADRHKEAKDSDTTP